VAEPTTLAYLAGMIDGDGYISITRSVRAGKEYFGAQIGIAGTRPEPHRLAASLWGGIVSRYEPANPNHRAQYQWQRMGASAVAAIEAIYPYLLIKQEHASLALALHEHVRECRSDDPFPWFSPDYDPVVAMRAMRDEMIALNQSRNRVGKKAAGRLLDGRTWDEVPEGAR
jgi:hypothetical protein